MNIKDVGVGLGVGTSLGLGFGAALGATMQSVGAWVAIGVASGVALAQFSARHSAQHPMRHWLARRWYLTSPRLIRWVVKGMTTQPRTTTLWRCAANLAGSAAIACLARRVRAGALRVTN